MIKSRRIKSEQITSLVNNYIKKRQFSDGSDITPKKEKKYCQGLEEMALSKAVGKESSLANYFTFSGVSGDASVCDAQYTRLKSFVAEAVEPYRAELQPILYPLFVHVYLELLCNGHKTPAHKFYSRHHSTFKDDETHQAVLNDLQQMFNKEDVTASKEVNEFRDEKYSLSISEDSFQYLFRFLKSDECVLLLLVFNKHFDFRVGEPENVRENIQLEEKNSDPMSLASPPCTPENKVIQNELTLSSLQQCIKKVRSGPPCLPSICLYTVNNQPHGLCSVDLSSDQSLVVTGCEDSTIKLWSLTPRKLKSEPCRVNVSNIHMAGDYEEDIINKNSNKTDEEHEVITMKGHSGAVYGACFTSDKNFVISASEDNTARIWDMKTHTNKAVYRGHNYPIWGIDTSPIGGYFATSSHDRTAKLWTTDRTFPLRTFIGHLSDVDCVKFHPNCNYIATGSSDRVVRLWSVQDGQAVRLFQGHKSSIYALAFSRDGNLLASAGNDRRIKIWDLSSGTLYKELKGHTDTIYSLSFNPESTVLASGGLDCTVMVWNIQSSAEPVPSVMTPNMEVTSPELLGSFPVRSVTLHHLHYTKRNLLIGIGSLT